MLLAEQDDLHERERALQPRRAALQRLIDIYEELARYAFFFFFFRMRIIAAVNAMTGKAPQSISNSELPC